MIKKVTFSPSAGIAFAIVGCILDDTATTDDLDTLITDIEALSQVTSVVQGTVEAPNDAILWGQAPATIEAVSHQCKVHVSLSMSCQVGYGTDTFSKNSKISEDVVVPVNKKWCVFPLVIPAELTSEAMITALETAMATVDGIAQAEHLVDGIVPSNAVGTQIIYSCRMRIDPIPV